jgi:hypothetical protein
MGREERTSTNRVKRGKRGKTGSPGVVRAGAKSSARPKKTAAQAARGRSSRLVRASATAQLDEEPVAVVVPTRWVKAVVGVFLLPVVWVWTQTFFGAVAWAALERDFWQTEEFWFFGLGALLYFLAFWALPRPMRIYVFGHELTHALTVWLMGGKVEEFRVTSEGGHVLTNKVNTWIALSPYFVPLYSVLVMMAWWITGGFVDVTPYASWWIGAVGFTWAFHFSFTCWMIPKGQSDLAYGGTFFSLVIIYLANLVVLSALLVIGSPEVGPWLFAHELWHNALGFLEGLDWLLHRVGWRG